MPEFEENIKKPDLSDDINQYQPSQRKPDLKSSHETPPTAHPSNMRGRWKPSSRGPVKPNITKKEEDQLPLHPISQTPPPIEEETVFHDEEPTPFKKEHPSKSQHVLKEKSTKPVDRKDVFIPKTKEESERHKTRHPSSKRKKTSLLHKILAFFGFASSKPKARKHLETTKTTGSTKMAPHKKYAHSKKHPSQKGHYKQTSRKGPKPNF